MYENFIRAIEAKGITPPAEIIADGEIHRFDSDHSGKSNGAYVLHSDEPQSGWFKCWKTGTENNWSRGYSETDPVKKEQFQKLIKQRTQERTVKILELQKNAAIKASTEYQDAKPADPDHPYLKRKQIKPVKGLKQDPTTGDLIVPIYCKNGNIISRQTINKEGDKYFLKDGQTKGGYFDFGETTENIVICEGFATGASIFEATGYRVRCGFNCGNLKEVAIISRDEYPKAHIIIAGDDDHNTKGNPGRIKAIEAASSIDTSVVFPDFGENRPEKATDFNDLHCLNGLDAVRKCFETIPETMKISLADTGLEDRQKELLQDQAKLVVLTLEELLKMPTPPRQNILSPWLAEQGLCMIYAARGLGKTWAALMIAYAVSSGGHFLTWKAEAAAGVLYIDGEMPLAVMKERLAQIVTSEDKDIQAPLNFLTPDAQEFGIPDLSTIEGQKRIDKLINEDTKLIVIDNLSTLTRTGKESEKESWLPVQEWALKLRRRGISVLFIHHAGKAGQQRGTSSREDVLDTVIALRKPTDYTPETGACFEIHFEKARGLYGTEVEPFEAKLESHEDNNGLTTINWIHKKLDDSTKEKVKRYLDDGWLQKDIADQLGINKSSVNYHVKKIKNEGLID